MKMSQEDFDGLSKAINAVLDADPELPAKYLRGEFPRADRVRDLNKRFRWDLFWLSGVSANPLYDAGLNDSHIDTALRRIVGDIKS